MGKAADWQEPEIWTFSTIWKKLGRVSLERTGHFSDDSEFWQLPGLNSL